MPSNKLHLTWDEYLRGIEAICTAVQALQKEFTEVRLTGVYGPSRGGLIPAVYLSHQLGLPLLHKPTKGMLWVDDILDSGTTLRETGVDARMAAVILAREPAWKALPVADSIESTIYFAAQVLTTSDWIVFPYERNDAPMEKDNVTG